MTNTIRLVELQPADGDPERYLATDRQLVRARTDQSPLAARVVAIPMVRDLETGTVTPATTEQLDALWQSAQMPDEIEVTSAGQTPAPGAEQAAPLPFVFDHTRSEVFITADLELARWLLEVSSGVVSVEVWIPLADVFEGGHTWQYTRVRVRVDQLFLTLTGHALAHQVPPPGAEVVAFKPGPTGAWHHILAAETDGDGTTVDDGTTETRLTQNPPPLTTAHPVRV